MGDTKITVRYPNTESVSHVQVIVEMQDDFEIWERGKNMETECDHEQKSNDQPI